MLLGYKLIALYTSIKIETISGKTIEKVDHSLSS